MWRKTSFAGSEDSDQSISEDEDLSSEWPEDCVALGVTAETKGGIQIQSQLEVLRDTRELDRGTETAILFNKSQTGFSSEDEVEIPIFHDDGDFISSQRMASTCKSEEEIISDNEDIGLRSPRREKQDGACTANKEAEAPVNLIEKARSSSLRAATSNVNKHYKGKDKSLTYLAATGGRGKAKSKFVFRFQSHKEDNPWPVSSNAEVNMAPKLLQSTQELEAVDYRTVESSTSELLENFQVGKIEQSEVYGVPAEVANEHDYTEHSMADILDRYQEKTGLPRRNSKTHTSMKGRRVQLVDGRNTSPLGERNMDNDDPPEALNSGSSTDDGVSPQAKLQNLGLIIPVSKQKTMTDKFQETFGAASINEEGAHFALHGIGIFGKLQRVMQSEKRKEMDFLKKLEIGASSKDEASCIDVEILSRCLEAKLTVCCCSLRRDNESFQWGESLLLAKENQRRTLTIIFSSRVCEDVELEVGNVIRIHSPWKKVQVRGKDEVIILSAYFSEILS
ncbi:Homeotic protein female sterile like [Actinidia chinensis var. chinensis]|uniref:Homeotic protein female sterile like n=1 Tax=Actinidia chinensis var. chinensis TaxID=1590841 RepID=A0A2R6QU68_ACTCC|nr:Homeotic protein female sterile like [Actinidia chinensis var. chinensis]